MCGRGVKLYYAYYVNSYSYVPEGDEDCLGVVYQGVHYSLRASEIKEIIGGTRAPHVKIIKDAKLSKTLKLQRCAGCVAPK